MSIESEIRKAIEDAQHELHRAKRHTWGANKDYFRGRIRGLRKALRIVQEHGTPKPKEVKTTVIHVHPRHLPPIEPKDLDTWEGETDE